MIPPDLSIINQKKEGKRGGKSGRKKERYMERERQFDRLSYISSFNWFLLIYHLYIKREREKEGEREGKKEKDMIERERDSLIE